MLKRCFNKLNKKAFTLVEIMFAVALLAVASIAIGSIILSTQNSTSQMFSESELQQQVVEVQEMIHNDLLATNAGIKYWTRGGSADAFALVDADTGGEYEKLIAFYSIDTKDYILTKRYYKWSASDKTLWVAELEETITKNTQNKTVIDVDSNISQTLSQIAKWTLAASNIESATFNVSNYEKNKLISFAVEIKQDNTSYPTNDVVYIRNKINVNEELVIDTYHSVAFVKPTLTDTVFTYDGLVHGPIEHGYYDRFIERVEGSTTEATAAGTYTITYRLKDKNATRWEDGSTDDVICTWVINKKVVGLVWGQTEWVYDGQEHYATCSFTNVLENDTCEVVLTNDKIGPNVGTQTCEVNVGNPNYAVPAIHTMTLKITKAAPQADIALVNRVYDTSYQNMTRVNSVVGGDIKYYISTSRSPDPTSAQVSSATCQAKDAGTYYVWYKIVADDSGNYNDTDVIYLGDVLMDRAQGSVTAPTAKDLVYNGMDQALVNAGSTPYGEIKYRLSASAQWSDAIPTGKNAGTYTVYYYSTGNNNYYPTSETASISVTIKQATPTVTIKTVNHTYDNTNKNMVEVSNLVGGTLRYYISTNNSTPNSGQLTSTTCTAKNAGTYYIWYKIVADTSGNYHDVGVTYLGTAKIDKATGSVTAPTARDLTFNTQAQTLLNAGSTPYGEIRYRLSGTSSWSTTIPTGTNATTYKVYYYSTGNDNYAATDQTQYVNVTIKKANPTVPISVQNQTFNNTNQNMVTVGTIVGGTIKYYISTSNTTPSAASVNSDTCQAKNAGTYYIWYKVIADSSGNYNDIGVTYLGYATMERAKSAYVYQTNTKEYHVDGNSKNGYSGYDKVDVTGTSSASTPGTHTFYATPQANYQWTDGGTERRTFTWKIIDHTKGPAATCTTPQKCTVCQAVLVAIGGHNYGSNVVAPTCTAQGYTTHTCSRCGDTYNDTYTPANGHNFNTDSGHVQQAASCTTDQYNYLQCGTCGHNPWDANYRVWIASAYGHNYNTDSGVVYQAQSCTADQYNYKKCGTCGDNPKSASHIVWIASAYGHNYSYSVTTAATCTAKGVGTYTCSNCSGSYTEEIAAAGHNWKKTQTYTTTAHYYYCLTCTAYKPGTYGEHSYTSSTVWAATCEETGKRKKSCTGCAYSYEETVPALGHKYKSQGDGTSKCMRCNNVKIDFTN